MVTVPGTGSLGLRTWKRPARPGSLPVSVPQARGPAPQAGGSTHLPGHLRPSKARISGHKGLGPSHPEFVPRAPKAPTSPPDARYPRPHPTEIGTQRLRGALSKRPQREPVVSISRDRGLVGRPPRDPGPVTAASLGGDRCLGCPSSKLGDPNMQATKFKSPGFLARGLPCPTYFSGERPSHRALRGETSVRGMVLRFGVLIPTKREKEQRGSHHGHQYTESEQGR
jgi:hypothetical protein